VRGGDRRAHRKNLKNFIKKQNGEACNHVTETTTAVVVRARRRFSTGHVASSMSAHIPTSRAQPMLGVCLLQAGKGFPRSSFIKCQKFRTPIFTETGFLGVVGALARAHPTR
jgi:hypothetical protein